MYESSRILNKETQQQKMSTPNEDDFLSSKDQCTSIPKDNSKVSNDNNQKGSQVQSGTGKFFSIY